MTDPGAIVTWLGVGAGLLALAGLRELVREAPGALRWSRLALEPLLRAGREGYLPSQPEYRRLVFLLTVLVIAGAWIVAGSTGALPTAVLAPLTARWLVSSRRSRYRDRLDAAIPDAANALADSLAAGRSLRASLSELGSGLQGAAAAEFAALAAEIELGSGTAAAIADLRQRNGSRRIDSFCSALLAGRRSGGDLAALMRRYALATAAQDRAARDARSATAQARFTGLIVVAMPLGAILFAELVWRGFSTSLLRSPLAIGLVSLAIAMQVAGFIVIRRLARPPH